MYGYFRPKPLMSIHVEKAIIFIPLRPRCSRYLGSIVNSPYESNLALNFQTCSLNCTLSFRDNPTSVLKHFNHPSCLNLNSTLLTLSLNSVSWHPAIIYHRSFCISSRCTGVTLIKFTSKYHYPNPHYR